LCLVIIFSRIIAFLKKKKRKKANLKKILINQPDKIADSDEKESIELERNNY